ncbi:FAD-binding oxidoreductase [Pseudorhizobium flavum]|uniref:Alkyldihydroxyacetonephosphate synthase n=1 Tax=Pseudorhizobium flavum TaxID=1335061 RepID=A0A7W9Z1T1_9HYPH|nr:FAD-binding oxidoreductase [Pseudorhizobium flavum]MBB6182475.1 alkyldihydroxyacetonephosphate synthase [Pseudorhizobium flavum]CAD6619037.1 FAD-binding oxidoreductase [Pseudorhizobium flavum]
MEDSYLVAALSELVGPEHVIVGREERIGYAHDRLPYANFRAREGALVGTLPGIVLRPATVDEVAAVVRKAAATDTPIIPYGSGSGVLGGIIPLGEEMMIDMRRMNRILHIDRENNLVTVEAGMNGEAFEDALNAEGYTSGHLPQSLTISTVGGWAACRGGGQESSRYGKIENIVVGLKAVMPDGRVLEVRPLPKRASGPSVLDVIVGSEGTLAIITELTMRIWKLPAAEEIIVLALPTRTSALSLAKTIMQAGLHPRIVRLYDEKETATRTEGIETYRDRPVMANIVVCGEASIVAAEAEIVRSFARELGAVETETRPFDEWREKRYLSITKQWLDRGYYNDTIEVTVNWSEAASLYDTIAARIAAEVSPDVHFSAHWSHVYPEGVCQYMTLRLPPMDQADALPMHEKLWEIATGETLAHGGSIAHHHGSGLFRGPWMDEEHGVGMDLLRKIKESIDPQNLFNPGKLGFPPRPGAVDPYRDRAANV